MTYLAFHHDRLVHSRFPKMLSIHLVRIIASNLCGCVCYVYSCRYQLQVLLRLELYHICSSYIDEAEFIVLASQVGIYSETPLIKTPIGQENVS